MGKLAYRIANAIHVTQRQFEITAEQRRGNLLGFGSFAGGLPLSEDRYATALRSQFIACSSASASSRTLMVRRDVEEAYVVKSQ